MKSLFFLIITLLSSYLSSVLACSCPHHAHDKSVIFKSKDGSIIVQNATFNLLNGADNGAAYCTINNESGNKDKLTNAYFFSKGIKTIELHTHIIDENQVAKMRKIAYLEIPQKGSGEKTLEPGGDHIMLIGTDKKTHKKNKLSLVLEFEKAGKIEVVFNKMISHKSCCSKN